MEIKTNFASVFLGSLLIIVPISQLPDLKAAEITDLKEVEINIEVAEISTEELLVSNQVRNSFSTAMIRVLEITNYYRQQKGLRSLQFNPQLMSAAQAHSNDMAKHGFLSHKGSGGSLPRERARQHGYRGGSTAENVASGQKSADAVVIAWMNSSGHRRNILNPRYREMGIGYNNRYWTQTFGG